MPKSNLSAVVLVALMGCASSTPQLGGTSGLDVEVHRHPYRAALYLSPELDVAEAEVLAPDGGASTVWMGEYLRSELVRTTERAFEGVVLIDEEIYTGPTEKPHPAPELWPVDRRSFPAPPDLIVACFPVALEGKVIDGGSCVECRDNLSFRVELYFEVRTLGGEIVTSGKIDGQGVDQSRPASELPVAARFRQAVAEAVDAMSTQYGLALGASPIAVPAIEDEHLAERPAGQEAG